MVIAILWHFFDILPVFLGIFSEIQYGILPGPSIEDNFGDLNDILAISWQFYLLIWCFLAVILYFLPFQGIFKAIFCLIFPI